MLPEQNAEQKHTVKLSDQSSASGAKFKLLVKTPQQIKTAFMKNLKAGALRECLLLSVQNFLSSSFL